MKTTPLITLARIHESAVMQTATQSSSRSFELSRRPLDSGRLCGMEFVPKISAMSEEEHVNRSLAFVLCAVMSLMIPSIVSAQERSRSLLFQFGIGYGAANYPTGLESALQFMESMAGVERTKVGIGMGLGIAVAEKGFLMFRVDGTGDRFDDSQGFMQVNLYLYSVGLRWYPSTTGLYVEGNAGSSAAVVQFSDSAMVASRPGFGLGGAIGWDFAKGKTGSGFVVEARANMLDIEDIQVPIYLLTIGYGWK
jgi:hypothetical protein